MWEPAEETANPCYESASRLRHLTIVNIAFPWESALLSHLRTLNIDLSEGDSPSAQQVMRILQSCPDLTTLKLHLPQGLHPSPVSLEAFTIELSRLQQLSLKVHPLMTGYLLRHMRIPLCKTFDVDQFGTTGPIFFASMDHLIPSLSSILLAASALSIRVAYNTLEYIAFGKIDEDEEEDAKCGELAQAIRIRASGEQFNESTSLEALSWLLDNVHPSSFSLPVLLEIFRQPTSPHVLTLLMDRFSPVITRLAFDQTAETIISYLAEPSKAIVDGTITLKWPLPNLTHLYIDYDTGLEPGVVLACVQRRAGRGLSSKGKRGCREELPATLIKLSLPCRTSTAEVM
ncbi:hypothetical protein FRB93_004458 [Tulasnella sp. JGI-2019a]|nr:hypothetical protein FRB93_004458 [Tulasnella sp. JGI-2019a]